MLKSCLSLLVALLIVEARADLPDTTSPSRDLAKPHGLSLSAGTDILHSEGYDYLLVTVHHYWGAQAIGLECMPEALRLKVELSGGLKYSGDERAMVAAAGILQYYVDALASDRLRPYLEGGFGVIYTDFRQSGQGLRGNFLTQGGIGCDLETANGQLWFVSVRWHHASNAGLHKDNDGLDSLLLTVGKRF